MANNYLQFSEILEHLTDAEVQWLRSRLEPGEAQLDQAVGLRHTTDDGFDEDEDFGFYGSFEQDEPSGRYLWFRAEECGNPERVAAFVQAFLRKFRPQTCWTLTYAQTCSKLRIGEFSGGALFVTAETIEVCDAAGFAVQRRQEFTARAPTPDS